MNRRPHPIIYLLVIELLLAGCGPTGIRSTPVSSQNQPTQAPTPQNPILYQDNFSDPNSGWDTSKDEHGANSYTLGGYRMTVIDTQYDTWAYPGKDFTDVQIEVDAIKLGGPDNNDFGLVCRLKDSDNFYFFTISSDGYYGISNRENGKSALLGLTEIQKSTAIRTGIGSNHLRADCIGSQLTLYVNQTRVYEIQDPSFTHGDVGLLTGTFDEPGTDILWKNFTVYKP